ncbi:hypothetical protein PR048_021048, partial [Dryococelus australis]
MKYFIGILLLSAKSLYWEESSDTYNRIVSDAFHCCKNENLDVSDRFTNVRPLFTMLNDLFQAYAPHSDKYSVDEAMVPCFGRHGCEQFIRVTPTRYGYKLWVGATSSGYVIWMEHTKVLDLSLGLGPSAVLQYADILSCMGEFPYHIFFDNFFTTRRLKGTGTIRDNRNSKCPLETTACMKKKQRGSFDSKVTKDRSNIVAKWHDNSIVRVVSNAESVHPLHSVSRFSRTQRKIVTVPQPHSMYAYNTGMGGVERRKKWYFPLIAHLVDIAEQNAWQLHKISNGKLDHLSFRRRIALALLEMTQRVRGKSVVDHQSSKMWIPRFDRLDHQEQHTRYRMCHKKVSTKCGKCDVALN